MAIRITFPTQRVSLDHSIERMRKQLAEFALFLGRGKPTRSLEEVDLETERLIGDLPGQASDWLHAYHEGQVFLSAIGFYLRTGGETWARPKQS
jgi:hypothetical protein